MLTNLLALAGGILIGLLGIIPGLHASVLLVGLLPILGVVGDAGAIALCGALGSGLVVASLAKTYHPATAETLRSATPEQVMAYKGRGLLAVHSLMRGTWVGLGLVLFGVVPLTIMSGHDPHTFQLAYLTWVRPITPWLVGIFFVLVVLTAGNKFTTVITMAAAGLLGFIAFSSPVFGSGSESLGPLLGGLFALPTLVMVIAHPGRAKGFPKQSTRFKLEPTALAGAGAAFGVLTAMTAGLGASAAVSLFAGRVKEEQYLLMQAASDAANAVFAVALLLMAGVARSGASVGVRTSCTSPPDTALGLMLLLAILFGVIVASAGVPVIASTYAELVGRRDQRVIALAVALLTVAIAGWHAGLPGLVIMGMACLVGLAAKKTSAPNQALVAVLAFPVLVYNLGLTHPLAAFLGLLH